MVNDGMRRKGLEDLVLLNYYPTAAFRKASEWKDIERVARGLIFERVLLAVWLLVRLPSFQLW